MNAKEKQKTKGNGCTEKQNAGAAILVFQPIRILVKRRWQLAACLLLVCSIAFAATVLRKPKYEATTKVQVVMDQPQMGGIVALAGGGNSDYFTTQCQLLRSRHVLSRTAEKLNADSGNWSFTDEGVKELQEHVKVKPISGSRLIDIVGVADTGPEAAAIANQLTAAFIETSTETRQAANARTVQQVQEQIAGYDTEIKKIEEQLDQFRQENLITGADSSLAAVESRIGLIEKELTDAQMKRLKLEAKKDTINNLLTSGEGLTDDEILVPEINTNNRVVYLRQNLNQLQEEESQLAHAYLPGHQKLRNVRIQIAECQASLLEQKKKLLQAIYASTLEEYSGTAKQENSLLGMLNQQKEIGVRLTDRHQEYQKLLATYEMAQKFKTDCIAQLRQFNLKEGMSESPVKVVDAAHIPTRPTGLNKVHQALSILLLGVLFSVAFVFVMERLTMAPGLPESSSPAVYMPMGMQPGFQWANGYGQPSYPAAMSYPTPAEEVEVPSVEMAGSTPSLSQVLGNLDDMELGGDSSGDLAFSARCRIVHTDQSSRPAEIFREIGTRLLGRFGKTQQNIVVTSDTNGNGKTTCACNLALFLARSGRKVLLVDANQTAPALDRVFAKAEGQPGLSEVLADLNVLEQAIQPTKVNNLMIIHQSTDEETTRSHEISQLSSLDHELRQRFDWVLYDAGSLSDEFTRELLQVIGKVLFVTSRTDPSDQTRTTEQIEMCGAVNLGFVNNECRVSSTTKIPGS
jgi:uncharacterized protein involved in exopolysaccharide biosynthesis/Mrp family chromosome partitioning ATPase